jgi:mannan endo-1,4-beta-mannosidase
MNLAAEKEAGGDPARLLTEMDQMAAAGINHIRIMAATQGAQDRQPFRVLPAFQDEAGHWDERLSVGLDRCIAEACKRGMRVTMVLGNTWQWTGGHAQLYA